MAPRAPHLLIAPLALAGALAAACGSGAPARTPDAAAPGGDAGGVAGAAGDARADASSMDSARPTDGSAPSSDALADGGARYDAGVRDVPGPPPEVAVAGGCAAGMDAGCPIYMGTSALVGSSRSTAAALGSDGALYIGGDFSGMIDFDPTAGMDVRMSAGGYPDSYINQLGPGGSYTRTSIFAGADNYGSDVASLSTTPGSPGSVFAVGDFNGTVDLDPGPGVTTVPPANSTDTEGTFAVKLNSAGGLVWARTLTAGQDHFAGWDHVLAAPDGTTYLTGTYSGPADLDPGPATHPPPNAGGAFFMHLDASGNLAGLHTLGGNACASDQINALAFGADGTPVLAGAFRGTCTFDQGSLGPQGAGGAFIAFLAADGTARRISTIVGSLTVSSMSVAADGALYIGGSASTTVQGQDDVVDFDPSPATASRTISASRSTLFVLKLDKNGAFKWVDLSSVGFDVNAVAATPSGGVIVAYGADYAKPPARMLVRALGVDQSEAWRLSVGHFTSATAVLVDAKGFIIVGDNQGPADLDPSAGIDWFVGNMTFASRYTF
jgi:hypothetical protein